MDITITVTVIAIVMELTHGLLRHLLQFGRSCEDCCKLVNIFLQHCTIIENDDGDLKGSDDDKCDLVNPAHLRRVHIGMSRWKENWLGGQICSVGQGGLVERLFYTHAQLLKIQGGFFKPTPPL